MYMVEGVEEERRVYLCESSSVYSRLGVGLIFLGLVLHIVGLASSYWVVALDDLGDTVWHEGIWQSCFKTRGGNWACSSYEVSHHAIHLPGWFHTTQAFSILALVTLLPSCFIALLYSLLPKFSKRMVSALVSTALEITSGVFILICVIVYRTQYPDPHPILNLTLIYHWSFGIEIVSVITCFATALLTLVDLRSYF